METETNLSLEIATLPSTDLENMRNIRKTLHKLQPTANKENLIRPARTLPCKETSEKFIISPDTVPSTDQENIKITRKSLHQLQPAADKEKLVGAGRSLPGTSKDKETSEKHIIPPDSKKRKRFLHKSTQCSSYNSNLAAQDITTDGEPSSQYWKTLAEKRKVALEETLIENKELLSKLEEMENLKEKNSTLKEKYSTLETMLEQANDLVHLLQEMLDEKEQEEKPPNNDDSLLN